MCPGDIGAAVFTGYIQNLSFNAEEFSAGDMLAGTYQYVYTWVRCLSTGEEIWESMPSPASGRIILADDEQISLTGIEAGPTLSTSQSDVMYRKLYRAETTDITGASSVGNYLFLARIENNTTTEWVDNTPSAHLGETFPYD